MKSDWNYSLVQSCGINFVVFNSIDNNTVKSDTNTN